MTRWEARSLVGWLALPIAALCVVALNYGLAAILPRRPGLFNHPEKEAFLALPPTRRAPVIARMRAFLYGISALLVVLFGVVQWTRYRTAMGDDSRPYVALTLVIGLMTGPIALGIWLPPISRDQASLYARRTFKPAWFTRAEVEANAVRSYAVGATGSAAPTTRRP